MSPRTVRFDYQGWTYQLYLQSLERRGREEPSNVSRCDVLGGALWMLRTLFWKRTLGAEVIHGDGMFSSQTLMELLGIGAILALGIVCAAFLIYVVIQVTLESGLAGVLIFGAAFALTVVVGMVVISIVVSVLCKIGFFRTVGAAYRFCRELIHFLHELLHHAVEGSILCPFVVVTSRPQTKQAK